MSRLYSSPEVMQLPSYPHRIRARSGAPNHDAVQIHVVDFANHRVQQRRVPQPAAYIRPPDQIIQPAKTSLIVLRDGFAGQAVA
jgi:hypothetical protein